MEVSTTLSVVLNTTLPATRQNQLYQIPRSKSVTSWRATSRSKFSSNTLHQFLPSFTTENP